MFVGNLGLETDQRKVEDIFRSVGLNPMRVRVLTDDTGKTKGAAFVDFETHDEAGRACSLDGRTFPGSHHRGLRVNPANSKPSKR